MDVILVHSVHVGEAVDLSGLGEGRHAVKEAVEVVLLDLGVKSLVVIIRVNNFALEAVCDAAEDELLVLLSGHEVDSTVSPGVGNEGEVEEVAFDVLVANLDASGEHLGRAGNVGRGVELVKPRASAVDHGVGGNSLSRG